MRTSYKISEDKFLEAKRAITSNGGTIYSNSFEISGVEGHFDYSDGTLDIVITDQPFLASDSMIKEKMDDFFL